MTTTNERRIWSIDDKHCIQNLDEHGMGRKSFFLRQANGDESVMMDTSEDVRDMWITWSESNDA